ncbi:hypothetical protein B0H10DRAFT_1943182 [Mycena sp. CBHHK59/15]|nr:hypothetical protein B0H10DRAFT_1943182 [Mycena sp. CBHHK59/15]
MARRMGRITLVLRCSRDPALYLWRLGQKFLDPLIFVGTNIGQIWQFFSAPSPADDAVTAPKELCRGTRKRDTDKLAQSLTAEKADDDGNPYIEGPKTSRAKAACVKGFPESVCDQEDHDLRLPDLVDP